MEKKKSYAGQIQNAGSQVVNAPCQNTQSGKGKATVHTGKDLRAGK